MGVAVPPKLFFVEARLAEISKDHIRAEQALTDYLGVSSKADEDYAAALSMYGDVQRAAAEQRTAGAPPSSSRPATLSAKRAGGVLSGRWTVKFARPLVKTEGTLQISEDETKATLVLIVYNWPFGKFTATQDCTINPTGAETLAVNCFAMKLTNLMSSSGYRPDTFQLTRKSEKIWVGSDSYAYPVEMTK